MLHRDNVMFGAIQGFFWAGFGLIFAFLSAYYQEIGFTTVQIGLVMALVSAANIAAQPVLALISDRISAPGLVLRNALLAGIVIALLMFATPPLLVPVAALSVLVSIAVQTLPPILDGWTMQVRELVPRLDYGVTRSMGSFGFAVTVAVAGRVFDVHGMAWMFPLSAVALSVTVAIVTLVNRYHAAAAARSAAWSSGSTSAPIDPDTPDPPDKASARDDASAPDDASARDKAVRARADSGTDASPGTRQLLLRFFSPQMTALLAISFVSFTAFRPTQVFLPVLLREVGGTSQDLGFGLSLMGISEFPFLIGFSLLVRRFGDTRILLVALVFFFVRIGALAFAVSPLHVILAQLLQGPSFGLFLPACVHLLNRLAPPGTRTVAQTAGAIASFGLGSMSGSAAGGYLAEWFGITGMYAIMAAAMAVTALAYCVLFVRPGLIAGGRTSTDGGNGTGGP